jgi:hypothetical protein
MSVGRASVGAFHEATSMSLASLRCAHPSLRCELLPTGACVPSRVRARPSCSCGGCDGVRFAIRYCVDWCVTDHWMISEMLVPVTINVRYRTLEQRQRLHVEITAHAEPNQMQKHFAHHPTADGTALVL